MTLDHLAMARARMGRIAIEHAVVRGLVAVSGPSHYPVLAGRFGQLDQALTRAQLDVVEAEWRSRQP